VGPAPGRIDEPTNSRAGGTDLRLHHGAQPDAIAGIERALFNTILNVTGRARFDSSPMRARHNLSPPPQGRSFTRVGGAIAWLDAAGKASPVYLDGST